MKETPAINSGSTAYLPALVALPAGTRITLRIQPRATRSEIVGPHGSALRVRLAAPPVDGAANDLLLRFLAERLGVPRTAVTLTGGRSSRSKSVTVSGLSPTEVATRLAAL